MCRRHIKSFQQQERRGSSLPFGYREVLERAVSGPGKIHYDMPKGRTWIDVDGHFMEIGDFETIPKHALEVDQPDHDDPDVMAYGVAWLTGKLQAEGLAASNEGDGLLKITGPEMKGGSADDPAP